MGHIDLPDRKKRHRESPSQLIFDYGSLAGIFFLVLNTVTGVRLREAELILKSQTGQAVLFVFGCFVVVGLWLVGRFRGER